MIELVNGFSYKESVMPSVVLVDYKDRAPIDELHAFAQFMKEANHKEEFEKASLDDRILAIAKIIDPAAFLPSRRDDDTFAVNAALGKARRIMELGV
jgi:hypothetical protein